MTESNDSKADSTRQQILLAAARHFARQPYHQVGIDAVLAEAELTKGAMYFHFRSKHAVALAIIGGLLGSLGATGLVNLVSRMGGMFASLQVNGPTMAVAMVVACLVGFLSAFVPSYHASQMDIVDGLRHIG